MREPQAVLTAEIIVSASLLGALASCRSTVAQPSQTPRLSQPSVIPAQPTASRLPTTSPWPTEYAPDAVPPPLPTFADPMGQIQALYEGNGGCEFPCWWGVSPGTNSLDDLQQLVAGFSNYTLILEGPFSPGGVISQGSRYILYYPPLEPVVDYSLNTTFYVLEGLIVSIQVDPEASRWHKLDPVNLVELQGPPQTTFVGDGILIMYYPDLRIMSEFTTYETSGVGARFCLLPKTGPIGWAVSYKLFENSLLPRVRDGQIHETELVAGVSSGRFYQSLRYSEDGYCAPLSE
jgi:hypothetical protein